MVGDNVCLIGGWWFFIYDDKIFFMWLSKWDCCDCEIWIVVFWDDWDLFWFICLMCGMLDKWVGLLNDWC